MGVTAAQSVIGKAVPITQSRGKFLKSDLGPLTFITIHLSTIYRHPEKKKQEKECRRFAEEMKLVGRKLRSLE
jgi:uracil-DNA glycosylase